MGAGHGHRLHYPGHSPVHRARRTSRSSRCSASCSSWSPRRATGSRRSPATWPCSPSWSRSAGCRRPTSLKRMVVELPFVVFALLLPFVATARRSRSSASRVSEPGCWPRWGLLAKGTLGVARQPHPRRDHRAARRAARAAAAAAAGPARADHGLHGPLPRRGDRRDAPDADRAARPAASTRAQPAALAGARQPAGALFIRSYERGERVHLAMLSRGYTGRLPT